MTYLLSTLNHATSTKKSDMQIKDALTHRLVRVLQICGKTSMRTTRKVRHSLNLSISFVVFPLTCHCSLVLLPLDPLLNDVREDHVPVAARPRHLKMKS